MLVWYHEKNKIKNEMWIFKDVLEVWITQNYPLIPFDKWNCRK